MMLQQTETVKRMTPDAIFRASFEHHPRSVKNHSLKKITKNPDFSGFSGKINGRGRRIRTLGTRFWRPLLYQLSYTPKSHEATLQAMTIMVGLRGLEPGTDRL